MRTQFKLIVGGKKSAGLPYQTAVPQFYDRILNKLSCRAGVDTEVLRDYYHDVLLRVLEMSTRRSCKTNVKDWGGYVTVAAIRDYWRSFRRARREVPFARLSEETVRFFEEEKPGRGAPARDVAETRQLGDLAWSQLEYLPLRQRYVLTMWCCGLSIGEIALQLDLSLENVRFHKFAAIRSVRERLGIRVEESA